MADALDRIPRPQVEQEPARESVEEAREPERDPQEQ
jgi:hypothetical protein